MQCVWYVIYTILYFPSTLFNLQQFSWKLYKCTRSLCCIVCIIFPQFNGSLPLFHSEQSKNEMHVNFFSTLNSYRNILLFEYNIFHTGLISDCIELNWINTQMCCLLSKWNFYANVCKDCIASIHCTPKIIFKIVSNCFCLC